MKEEIAGGLRNALDRGTTMEDAVRSFINAGYSPQEVREAAQSIIQGAASALNSAPVQPKTPLLQALFQKKTLPQQKPIPIVNPLPISQTKLSPNQILSVNQQQLSQRPRDQQKLSSSPLPQPPISNYGQEQTFTVKQEPFPIKNKAPILIIIILVLLVLIILGIIFNKNIIDFFGNLLK